MNKENFIHSIYRSIIETAENEDIDLKSFGKGIIDLTEKALVYLIAKRIKKDTKLGKYISGIELEEGRVDLTLKTENFGNILMEFKRSGRWDDKNRRSYSKDIEKLEKKNKENVRIFCALIDASTKDGEKDDRIIKIEKKFAGRIERIPKGQPFKSFSSTYGKKSVTCIIGCWNIKNI